MEGRETAIERVRRSRAARPIATAVGVLVITGGALLAGRSGQSPAYGHEGTVASAGQKAFEVFSHASPSEIIENSEKRLFPKNSIEADSFALTRESLIASGDCTTGGTYSYWEETRQNLKQVKCGETEATIVSHEDPAAVKKRFKKELKRTGSDLVNAVPGQAHDFKQKGQELIATQTSTSETFKCPRKKSKKAATSFRYVQLSHDHKSELNFCQSKKTTTLTKPSKNDRQYRRALRKYLNDKHRKDRPWAGEYGPYDLFILCPEKPDRNDPRAKFHYLKNSISVAFDGADNSSYCDKVGRYTTEIKAEVRKGDQGKFKKVGRSILHISGLEEILAFSDYGLDISRQRNKARIKNVPNLCEGGRDPQLRLRFAYRFKPKRTQQYQHAQAGKDSAMRSGFGKFITQPHRVCK